MKKILLSLMLLGVGSNLAANMCSDHGGIKTCANASNREGDAACLLLWQQKGSLIASGSHFIVGSNSFQCQLNNHWNNSGICIVLDNSGVSTSQYQCNDGFVAY